MKLSLTSSVRPKNFGNKTGDLQCAFDLELRRVLRKAKRDPGCKGVHTIRKGITKLRSWLRLVREQIGSRQFRAHNRRLRKAARALAPIRDARVMRKAFAAISSKSLAPNTSRHLHKQERCAKQTLAAALRKVKRCLKKELTASNHLPLEKITRADFAVALKRMRAEMESASAAANDVASTEVLHRWRKRTKNFLHAHAFVEGKKDQSAARLNQLLGKDHDLALLAVKLSTRRDQPEIPALLALIAGHRAELRRRLTR